MSSTSTWRSLLAACLLCVSLLCLLVSALANGSASAPIYYRDICSDNFYGDLAIHTTGWEGNKLWDVYLNLCGWPMHCPGVEMACAIMRKIPGQNVTDPHAYVIAPRSSSQPYTWFARGDGVVITAKGSVGECPFNAGIPTTIIQVLCGGSLVVPTPRTDQVAIDPQSCTFAMTVYHPLGCVLADYTK